MNTIAFATAALVAAAIAVPASATIITFDALPNGAVVPIGTTISTQYASLGVTFTGMKGTTLGAPTATDYSGGPVGPNYDRNYLLNVALPSSYNFTLLADRYEVMSAIFSTPVDTVSFSLNTFFTQGSARFMVYDAGGTLLQNVVLSANGGWDIKSINASAISRIDMYATTINGTTTAMFGIDQLNFTQRATAAVPEPTSWAMMIAGFGLVGGAMRRRKVSTTVRFA